MGIMEGLFGKKVWTTKETVETTSDSESGKRKTTKRETTTEKDSNGNTVSKITTTEESEKEQ